MRHVPRWLIGLLLLVAAPAAAQPTVLFVTQPPWGNDFATVITAAKNLRNVELGREMARADVDRRAAELDRARGIAPGGVP